MTRGRIYAATASLAVGVIVAVVVGDVTQSCSHSCPAFPSATPCTGGPQCSAGFYWAPALIAGTIAFLVVLALGLAGVSAFRADR